MSYWYIFRDVSILDLRTSTKLKKNLASWTPRNPGFSVLNLESPTQVVVDIKQFFQLILYFICLLTS